MNLHLQLSVVEETGRTSFFPSSAFVCLIYELYNCLLFCPSRSILGILLYLNILRTSNAHLFFRSKCPCFTCLYDAIKKNKHLGIFNFVLTERFVRFSKFHLIQFLRYLHPITNLWFMFTHQFPLLIIILNNQQRKLVDGHKSSDYSEQ